MEKDKISVIIPTYNRAKTIKKAVESVIEQSYKNLEIIIVDDGSTDDTESIIKQLGDERIIYVKQANLGACAARNAGIKIAAGKYISFQDSDDIYRKNKISEQYKNIIKCGTDLDFCAIKIRDGGNIFKVPAGRQIESIDREEILDELCIGNFISTQAILMKSDVAKKELFDNNMPRLQEYDLLIRLLGKKYSFSFTSMVLADVYRQEDSLSRDYQKLLNATSIMLKKDYRINSRQKEVLKLYLNTLTRIDGDNDLSKIKNDFNVYKTEKEREIEKLVADLSYYKVEYQKILNSKTWKLKTKLYKIIFGK